MDAPSSLLPAVCMQERWLDVTNSGLVTHGSGQTSSVAQSAAAAYDAVQAAAASRTGSQSACPFKIATADASASGPETAPKAASDPWVGGTGSVSNKRQIRYMPFSDGARNCVGQHLAVATVKACVAAAACSLHLELSPRMGDVHEVLGRKRVNLTLEVDGGMWMHARPLNASELQCIMQDGL